MSTFNIDSRLHHIVAAQPYPWLFATISGAHLYGFSSPDSDYDLRGAHVLPLEKVVRLRVADETLEDERVIEGLEMDDLLVCVRLQNSATGRPDHHPGR